MTREDAHYRRHPSEPGVDLLTARYVTHRYSRHAHPTYTIGLIESGVEEFDHAGTLLRAGEGPGRAPQPRGRPHRPGGRARRAGATGSCIPAIDVVTGRRGRAGHAPAPRTSRAPWSTTRAAARAAALGPPQRRATATPWRPRRLLRTALAGLLAPPRLPRPPAPGGGDAPARAVRAAREILHERLTVPPTLEQLAAAVGVGPFALLRAFRAAYGLPPHAYLTNLRVQRAREMLDAGLRPAEVAAHAGFSDQAHLTRHFKRIVGVPPGAYLLGRTP